MKSLLTILKKFDILFIFCIFSISTFFYCFTFELTCIDELWNFQNIYKMYNGFEIYNDCNVIITPLFFWIGELFFNLLSPNLITFKLYNLIIFSVLFTCIYVLFKTLNLSKIKSLFFTSIIFAVFFEEISGGANYNNLAILFVILGTIFLIKSRQKNIYIFLNGIAIYLITFTKQSIGVYYLLGVCLCELFLNKNLFITIKRLALQLSSTFILTIITLIYMYNHNIFFGFLNYAVFGMKEFSIKNILLPDLGVTLTLILIFIVYIFTIYIIKKKLITNSKIINNLVILLAISAVMTLTVYPIFNFYHVKAVLVFVIILFIYIIDILVLTPLLDKEIYNTLSICVTLCIITFILLYTTSTAFVTRKSYDYYDISHPYYYCYLSDENKAKINSITEYIKNKNSIGIEVIIASDQAALYMVPLKQSHGYFDLPFVGNFGKDGEDGVIETIKKAENSQFLIVTNEEDMFWQESKKVREYIINNLQKVGEIEEFSIYE